MKNIISLKDKDLGVVYLSVTDVPEETKGTIKLSRKEKGNVMGNLEDAFDSVSILVGKIAKSIINNPIYPDEIECKLGIKFTAGANIIISNIGTEGNLEITLKWNSKQLADREK